MLILAQYKIKPASDARFLILNGHEWIELQRYEKRVFYPEEYSSREKWGAFVVNIPPKQFDPRTHGQLTLQGF